MVEVCWNLELVLPWNNFFKVYTLYNWNISRSDKCCDGYLHLKTYPSKSRVRNWAQQQSRHSYTSGMWVVVDWITGTKWHYHVFKLRLDNVFRICYYFRFNSQHDWGGGDFYDYLMSTRIFTLIMMKIFIRTPKIMRQMLWTKFGFANPLAIFACFISYEKWM
jgi:hypothetical protein